MWRARKHALARRHAAGPMGFARSWRGRYRRLRSVRPYIPLADRVRPDSRAQRFDLWLVLPSCDASRLRMVTLAGPWNRAIGAAGLSRRRFRAVGVRREFGFVGGSWIAKRG